MPLEQEKKKRSFMQTPILDASSGVASVPVAKGSRDAEDLKAVIAQYHYNRLAEDEAEQMSAAGNFASSIPAGISSNLRSLANRVTGDGNAADTDVRVGQARSAGAARRDVELVEGLTGSGMNKIPFIDQVPGFTRGAAVSGAQALLAAPTGGLGMAAAFAATTGNEAWVSGKDRGLAGVNLIEHVAAQGGLEAGIMMAFGAAGRGGAEKIIANIGKENAAKAIAGGYLQAAKVFRKDLTDELVEEMLTGHLQEVASQFSGAATEDMTPESMLEMSRQIAGETFMMTAGAKAASGVVDAFEGKPRPGSLNDRQPSPVAPSVDGAAAPLSQLPIDMQIGMVDAIMSDGKPRTKEEIAQELVDRGHSPAEFAEAWKHLGQQVGKGEIESTDDGKYYRVEAEVDDAEEAVSPGETVSPDMGEAPAATEEYTPPDSRPLIEIEAEEAGSIKADDIPEMLGGAGGGMVDGLYKKTWEDLQSGKLAEMDKPPLFEQLVLLGSKNGVVKDESDLRVISKGLTGTFEEQKAAGMAALESLAEKYAATEVASPTGPQKPLADMTPEEVEAVWRESIPDAPRRAPARSEMIQQIEGVQPAELPPTPEAIAKDDAQVDTDSTPGDTLDVSPPERLLQTAGTMVDAKPGDILSVAKLRDAIGDGMNAKEFQDAIAKLESDGVIDLTMHPDAGSLSESDRAKLVPFRGGLGDMVVFRDPANTGSSESNTGSSIPDWAANPEMVAPLDADDNPTRPTNKPGVFVDGAGIEYWGGKQPKDMDAKEYRSYRDLGFDGIDFAQSGRQILDYKNHPGGHYGGELEAIKKHYGTLPPVDVEPVVKPGLGRPAKPKPTSAIPGGITDFLKDRKGVLPKNVINQNPSGTFGFAGKVSGELLWEKESGEPVTSSEMKEIAEAATFGARFGISKAESLGIRQRSYATRAEAEDALSKLEQSAAEPPKTQMGKPKPSVVDKPTSDELLPWYQSATEDETRWTGTKVKVFPVRRSEEEYEGTVTRVLNGGAVVEVQPDGQDGTFRVASNQLSVGQLVDSKATTAPKVRMGQPKVEPEAEPESESVALVKTIAEIDALPQFSIYRRAHAGGTGAFQVRGDGPRGGGDSIHSTYAQAVEQAGRDKAQSESHKAMRDSAAATKKSEDDKESAAVASYKGFQSDSPMNFGKSRKSLETEVRRNDKLITRKDLIESLVGRGWTVQDTTEQVPLSDSRRDALRRDSFEENRKNGRSDRFNEMRRDLDRGYETRDAKRLVSPDGAFIGTDALTLTGMKYADHLIVQGKASSQSTPAEESPSEAEMDAAIEAEFDKQGLGTKPDSIPAGLAVVIQGPESGEPKKSLGKPKTKIQAAADKASDDFDSLLDEFIAKAKNKLSSGLDPELAQIAVRMVGAAVKRDVLKFAAFVEMVAAKAPADLMGKLGPYLESAWRVSIKRGLVTDPVGKTSDVLNDYKPEGASDGKARQEQAGDEGAGADAGVGDSTGQPPADVPATASVDATGGDVERGPSQPSEDVLPGDGASETGDADIAGGSNQGSGPAANDSGSESGLGGRKTPGRRGAKDADGVQGEDSGRNHVIEPGDKLAATGQKTSLNLNVSAIKLLKKLESEGRDATVAEKKVLARFTGWGGISQVFDSLKFQASERPYHSEAVANWRRQYGDDYLAVKDLLTEDEWSSAAATTINAHYTSRSVIESMWGVAEMLGFTGGRVLELGAGIGPFAGLIPGSVRDSSQFTMVEMDTMSARITQKLYPEAEVIQGDLNDVQIQPGKASLATGNVPFSEGIQPDAKKRYGIDLNLHNYFIARTIDGLAPGGIGVVITTNATMDNQPAQRRFLAERADFLGIIRLPNDAFKDNAKTEVTTDILVFRKLDGDARIGADIRDTTEVDFPNSSGMLFSQRINEYFIKNPGMVLGRHSSEGKLYTGNSYTVSPIPGAELKTQIRTAAEKIPKPRSVAETSTGGTLIQQARPEFAEGRLQIVKGAPTVAISGVLVKLGDSVSRLGYPVNLFKPAAIQRAKDYIGLRDSYADLRSLMMRKDATDPDIKSTQQSASKLFDAFVKNHGHMDSQNVKVLKRDPGFYAIASLETQKFVLNEKTDQIETMYGKADIFTKRTIGAPNTPDSADTVTDAAYISINIRGKIDPEYVAELTGKSAEDARTELVSSGLVFIDPVSQQVEMRDEYLSGNVKKKLADAKVALKADPSYQRNVDELTKVIPEDKLPQQIAFKLGDAWIDPSVVQSFARDYFRARRSEVVFNPDADAWRVVAAVDSAIDAEIGGTTRMSAAQVLEKTLNFKSVNVYDEIPDGFTAAGNPRTTRELNKAMTQAARRAQDDMQKAFQRFVKGDDKQSTVLAQNYNDIMNTSVATKFDGSHLELPGKATSITMRPYQLDAIWRIIKTGRAMLAHTVGAGKTYTMIGAAMELKRLGLANRSLMVVQNATLGQFATSFMVMYPNAKVLVATTDDLQKENRQLFLNRMTSEDWDAIVMAQSTYENLAPSLESESRFLNRKLQELEVAIADATAKEDKKSPTVKQLQKNKNALAKRIKDIQDKSLKKRESNTVDFDSLDVDAIFLDEAHAYKKPFFITKIENLVGLNKVASARGISTQVKLDTIRAKTGGRNVVLATGTPITNTLGEAYHMASFVSPEVNVQFGVETFDRFIGSFANVEPTITQNAGGAMVTKDAIKSFRNGDSLMQYLQSSWDIFTPEMLRSYLLDNPGKDGIGLPEIVGGKPETVIVERPEGVANFMNYILDVYQRYSELKGEDRRTFSWIPVVLTGASRTAAMDLRLIYPSAKADEGGKVSKAAEVILRDYKASMEIRGTQLVFSDIRNPRTMQTIEDFMDGELAEFDSEDSSDSDSDGVDSEVNEKARNFFFDQITAKLVAGGIPRSQIAYITDANTAVQRDKLFARVNSGEIRVLMGSTSKMGVGVNVQERIVSVHEMDAVYVPSDSEQRHGRAVRFGNKNKFVAIYRYAMKDTFDGVVFEASLRKSKFIWQALSGKAGNEFEDPSSEATVSLEEAIAAISGSPLPAEKFKLQGQLRDLVSEEESFAIAKGRAKSGMSFAKGEVARLEEQTIPRNQERLAEFQKIESGVGLESPVLVAGGKTIADTKEVDAFFANAVKAMQDQFAADTKDMKDGKAEAYAKDIRSSMVEMNGVNVWLAADRMAGRTELFPHEIELGLKLDLKRSLEVSARVSLASEPNLNLYFGSAKTGTGIFTAIKGLKESLVGAAAKNQENLTRQLAQIESFERQIQREWDGGAKAKVISDRLAEIEAELLASGSLVSRHVKKPVVVDITDVSSGDAAPPDIVSESKPTNELDQFLTPRIQGGQSMGAAKRIVSSAEDLVDDYAGEAKGSSPYQFEDPESRREWDVARKGLTPRSFKQKLMDFAVAVKNNLVRGALPELARTSENADGRAFIREFMDAPHQSAWAVNSLLGKTVKPLQGHDMELFTLVVILRDLQNRPGLKPFKLTEKSLEAELKKFEGMLAENPRVAAALDFRKQWFEAMRNDYIDSHRKLGIDMSNKLKNEDYFRHQVLEKYMVNQGMNVGSAGNKVQVSMGRSFLKRAVGSELMINANYLQAEWEVATQMIADTKRARVIHELQQRYDIRDKLKNEAKAKNYEMLVGGPKKVKRINELRKKRAETKPTDKKALDLIREELRKIDPLFDFRKKIAMYSSRLTAAEPYLKFVDSGTFFSLAHNIAVDVDHKSNKLAAGLLAAINDQSQFIENSLGDNFLTWEKLVPETHTTVTTRPGSVVFAAYTVPEKMANELLADHLKRLGISADDLTKATVIGPKYTPMVVPVAIAAQMESISKAKGENITADIDGMIVSVVRKWKGIKLLGPQNIIKYNLRNFSEIDKILALNPSAANPALVWRSAKELLELFTGGDDISPDVKGWLEMGGASTLQIVNDVMDLSNVKQLKRFFESKSDMTSLGMKGWQGYWEAAAKISNYRESILRYSAYLAYKAQIDKNGHPNNYGGSNAREIKGISDPKRAAFRLSADLLGDYGDLSPVGQWTRDRLIPFWAFQETNFRSYFNGVQNLARDERLAGKVGMNLAKEMGIMAITRSPWLAIRLGRIAILMGGAQVALSLWNTIFFPDEEEELPQDVQDRPHLTFGRRPNGDPMYFDRLGTSSDILDWFGLDTLDSDIRDVMNNRKTIKEVATDMAWSPVNKVVQGLNPMAKVPAGLLYGKDLYPDFREPRSIRDKGEFVAKALSVDVPYRWVTGMPTRGLGDAAFRLFAYSAEIGSADYYSVLDRKYSWNEKNGSGGRFSFESPKSDAMRNYKQAVRYKDEVAAVKYKAEYEALGGSEKGMAESIKYLHPLSGLSVARESRFMATLNESELTQLSKAEKFAYESMMTPEQAEAVKKFRAGRVVDAAKTVIVGSGRPNPKTNSDYANAIKDFESDQADIGEWLQENKERPDVQKAIKEVVRSDGFKEAVAAQVPAFKPGKETGRDYQDRLQRANEKRREALKWRSALIVD